MKKVFAVLFVIALAATMYSCKGHEKCPAYGKADVSVEKSV